MEHNGGMFGVDKVVVDLSLAIQPPLIDMEDDSKTEMIQAQDTYIEAFPAYTFLLGSGNARFVNMVDDI